MSATDKLKTFLYGIVVVVAAVLMIIPIIITGIINRLKWWDDED